MPAAKRGKVLDSVVIILLGTKGLLECFVKLDVLEYGEFLKSEPLL